MNLALSTNEKELLVALLTHHVAETLVGIRRSWHREYKERLELEETMAQNLLDKINKLTAAA